MGCMLRSDYMTLCDLYLQPDAAFNFLHELGVMGCAQFVDLNPELQAFQRRYVVEVCRFSEMERKLWNIEAEMKLHDIALPDQIGNDISKMPPLHEIFAYEAILDKWDNDLQEMQQNEINLMNSFLELTELQYVLEYIGPLLGESEIRKEFYGGGKKKSKDPEKGKRRSVEGAGAQAAGDALGGALIVVTGVVKRKTCFAFERMLWRISHGIIYYKQATDDKILIDPKSKEEIRKVAFLAICQGKQLAVRVRKICSGFQVNTYPCPNTYKERMELMGKLDVRISDLQQVLDKTNYLRCKALRTVSRHWHEWMTQIRKAKAVYHTMNMFNVDVSNKCLIGQCWIPDVDFPIVNESLHQLSESLNANVPSFTSKVETLEMPPTNHRTNKFTRGFQNLINAYGDSTYRELNPGLYTIITFPFLFAMMFGDIGHGFIMFMFAAWMWKNEKQFIAENSTNEIWNICFGGRYVVLLMGLFSMFTGFCYNDMFAKAMSITTSYWMNIYNVEELSKSEFVDIDPSAETGTPYIFGKDPLWSKTRLMSSSMRVNVILKHSNVFEVMYQSGTALDNELVVDRVVDGGLGYRPESPLEKFTLNIQSLKLYYGILYSDNKRDRWNARETYATKTSGWEETITNCFLSVTTLRKNTELRALNIQYLRKIVQKLEIIPTSFLLQLAKNKIMFENSIKMKLSIIIGIVHMQFGIILSFFNHRYFGRTYSIILQFIPEFFFLTFFFFWLVVLIYYKWFTYSAKSIDPERDTACAPQILILFIDMALMSETKPVNDCKEPYMFPGQRLVQTILVFLAVICVPLLLFGTPLYKRRLNAKKRKQAVAKLAAYQSQTPEVDKKYEQCLINEVDKLSVPFGELMIHQGVHTIEFVLSTISHTASYLRLWALSLAHAQLSEMLWTMILSKLALHDHSVVGGIKLYFIFSVWAVFTIAILVVMEGLSAFLHTLRLHWVEFMSKFYSGGGYPFRPFSFAVILESDSDKADAGCKKFLGKE